MDKQKLKVVISGGGTGGHLFPVFAIADELKKKLVKCQIHFVGSKFGMEAKYYLKRDESYTLLNIRGFARGQSIKNLLRNLLFPLRFVSSYLHSRRLLTRIAPDVVVGTGGYASGLPLLAAIHKDIPTVIHEQNSYPGFTTRWLANRVTTVCISYEITKKFLKKKAWCLPGIPLGRNY